MQSCTRRSYLILFYVCIPHSEFDISYMLGDSGPKVFYILLSSLTYIILYILTDFSLSINATITDHVFYIGCMHAADQPDWNHGWHTCYEESLLSGFLQQWRHLLPQPVGCLGVSLLLEWSVFLTRTEEKNFDFMLTLFTCWVDSRRWRRSWWRRRRRFPLPERGATGEQLAWKGPRWLTRLLMDSGQCYSTSGVSTRKGVTYPLHLPCISCMGARLMTWSRSSSMSQMVRLSLRSSSLEISRSW